MTSLADTPDAAQGALRAVAGYPPPYRLRGDIALFPLLVESKALERLFLTSPASLFRRGLLWLIAARYYQAWYGPAEDPYLTVGGDGDVYREMGYALLLDPFPHTLLFEKLWVDAPDAVPLELGWHYGFPKEPASVVIQQEPSGIHCIATNPLGLLASVDAQPGVPLPAFLVSQLAAARVFFPGTRQHAGLRTAKAMQAKLLHVKSCQLPELDHLGTKVTAPIGLWLRGADLLLSTPRALARDRAPANPML